MSSRFLMAMLCLSLLGLVAVAVTACDGTAKPDIDDTAKQDIDDAAMQDIDGTAKPDIDDTATPGIDDQASPDFADTATPADPSGGGIDEALRGTESVGDEGGLLVPGGGEGLPPLKETTPDAEPTEGEMFIRSTPPPTEPTKRGKVIGCTEPPTPGVEVQLSGTATGTTTTDANGCYEFDNLADGSYSVSAADPSGTMLTPTACPATVSSASTEICDFAYP